VQHDPSDHEAWYALGLKQQENEREDQAIRALSKVIDLDPDYRPAYLALAVSYTNEGTHQKARVMLDRWIQMAETGGPVTETDDLAAAFNHQQLVERLIDLARTSPEEVDPDVQIALGVLFNSSEVSLSLWDLERD
jgi:peroxin-5